MENARNVLEDRLDDLESQGIRDWSRIKSEVRSTLSEFVWKETQRDPMILPIIQEIYV